MKKFLAIFLALVVLGIGANFMIDQFRATPPSTTITVGDKKVSVAQGSYCWRGFLNAKCVDMISPPEIIKHQGIKPTIVSPEAELKIDFKNKPNRTIEANIWINNGETEAVPLNDNILIAPKDKGVYVYDIFAKWEKGDSSYVFVIEVKTKEEDSKTLPPFKLTSNEEKAYENFQNDFNLTHLNGLEPISIAKLYVKAGFERKYAVQYALYTDRVRES
ncbi:hypothetical protein [Bacillus sp. OK048]|uniref:hypothetical protein n=1 Tax=Bacillus sp. OK048 TaxID=1882761 RepID=UPI00088E9678|nr:hypothetical protein [Bacillus sp. OK048]SDN22480.1 hypothetical protein SAMN05443253_10996 [Bacillus sp. OK048]